MNIRIFGNSGATKACSLRRHRRIFDAHPGAKIEHTA